MKQLVMVLVVAACGKGGAKVDCGAYAATYADAVHADPSRRTTVMAGAQQDCEAGGVDQKKFECVKAATTADAVNACEGILPAPAAAPAVPARNAPPTAEVLARFDGACDAGTANACFDAGMRRAKGMGTARDRVAAVVWLEKGCKLDDAESCGLLAGFLAVGDEGVGKNEQRAFELHQKACPRRPASCTTLAAYYGRGELVPKDEAKAMAMLEQGCNAGDGGGCEQLAQMLADGDGVAKDEQRAFTVAKKACDLDAYSCETLGAFYIGGTGIAKDVERGVGFVDKACKAGSKHACDGMATLRGP